jgi:hypothetical protein
MTSEQTKAVQSGAQQVEETEHLEAGTEVPEDPSIDELEPQEPEHDEPLKTSLGELTLSMFQQGASVRVRVGNAHNSSEMYEHAFASADEANSALLDAGVLTKQQVPDMAQLAGTGITLHGVDVQQLEEAGLKRHGSSTL